MKKKKVMVLLILVALIATALGSVGATFALGSVEMWDSIFMTSMSQLLTQEEIDGGVMEVDKQLIYDINLQPVGYIYDFIVGSNDGYAIMVSTEIGGEIAEIYINGINPYLGVTGLKIYISNASYIKYENDAYRTIKENAIIPLESIELLAEEAYFSYTGDLPIGGYSFWYHTRTENKRTIVSRMPTNEWVTNLANGCVPIAASTIITFYDRTRTNLIPDYTPSVTFGDQIIFNSSNATTSALVHDLAIGMRTNVGSKGTSIPNYLRYMSAYCSARGYKFTTYELPISNGWALNYSLTQQYIRQGIPLMLFVTGFTLSDFTNRQEGSESVTSVDFIEGVGIKHAMAVYGYNDMWYYDSSGSSVHDSQFLHVATGFTDRPQGWYNFNARTTRDYLAAVSID